MSKSALEAPRVNAFLLCPDQLTLIEDKNHPLYDPRVEWPVDENLVRSIMYSGVKVPILVRKEGDKIVVVDGRQRVKATVEANKRLTKEGKEEIRITAHIERGDDADLFGTMVSTNAHRRGDNALMAAEKLKKFLSMGRTEEEAGVVFGLSKPQVKASLALLDCCAAVKKAVADGSISPSAATKLASLGFTEQAKALEELKQEGGKVTARRTSKKAGSKNGTAVSQMPQKKQIKAMLGATQDALKVALTPEKAALESTKVEAIKLDTMVAVLNWVLTGDMAGINGILK